MNNQNLIDVLSSLPSDQGRLVEELGQVIQAASYISNIYEVLNSFENTTSEIELSFVNLTYFLSGKLSRKVFLYETNQIEATIVELDSILHDLRFSRKSMEEELTRQEFRYDKLKKIAAQKEDDLLMFYKEDKDLLDTIEVLAGYILDENLPAWEVSTKGVFLPECRSEEIEIQIMTAHLIKFGVPVTFR